MSIYMCKNKDCKKEIQRYANIAQNNANENTELTKQLEITLKYADHKWNCKITEIPTAECSCGWNDAKEALRKIGM